MRKIKIVNKDFYICAPTLILYGCPLEFFVFLVPFKSYWIVLIWLEMRHLEVKTGDFRGFFTP
jgi:hypothetical protein